MGITADQTAGACSGALYPGILFLLRTGCGSQNVVEIYTPFLSGIFSLARWRKLHFSDNYGTSKIKEDRRHGIPFCW